MCLTYDRLNHLGKQIVKLTNASPFIEVPPTSEESRDDYTQGGESPTTEEATGFFPSPYGYHGVLPRQSGLLL
jgi:hypothetical protein